MKSITLAGLVFTVAVAQVAQAQSSVDYIRNNAVEVDLEKPLPDGIFHAVTDYRVLWLGEMHGTNESPAAVLKFVDLQVRHGRKVLVGLEIPDTDQAAIRQAIAAGDETKLKTIPFFTRSFQDGRASEAMARLLMSLRSSDGSIVVYCLDSLSISSQDRDTNMAKNLIKAIQGEPGRVAIVLTGNIHSRATVGIPDDASYRPAGYEAYRLAESPLKQEDILSVLVRYQGGEAWVYMSAPNSSDSECKAHHFDDIVTNYSSAITFGSYFLKDEAIADGHEASLFSRKITASLPLVAETAPKK